MNDKIPTRALVITNPVHGIPDVGFGDGGGTGIVTTSTSSSMTTTGSSSLVVMFIDRRGGGWTISNQGTINLCAGKSYFSEIVYKYQLPTPGIASNPSA